MTHLPTNTLRRLKRIPQVPFSTWEGDRRLLPGAVMGRDNDEEEIECILWVDGTEGLVRFMEMVTPDTGPEAMARSLLRAIEMPNSPGQPSRPQKVVVRDREVQFFLRGALQELGITVDYVPDLPIIDELFSSLVSFQQSRPPTLPPDYQQLLRATAAAIWEAEPWSHLGDHQIFAIHLNYWDTETLYVSLMGMLGKEYGVLLYRSLDSFQRFRSAIVRGNNLDQLEQAFLSQDCWFLNFEACDEDLDDDRDLYLEDWDDIEPLFGSVHPLEGIRSALDEEEAPILFVALQALLKFFQAHAEKLDLEVFPALRESYRINLPTVIAAAVPYLEVGVETLPDLADELAELAEAAVQQESADESSALPVIHDDLVPDNSFLSLGFLPWDMVAALYEQPRKCLQKMDITPAGEGLPVVMIQTSRPKAKDLIARLQTEGGLSGIGFNPGEDTFGGQTYDLGVLQTGGGTFYLFGEFLGDDPTHIQARKHWNRRLRKTQGYCGLIVSMGLTGAHRGNPRLQDMLAFFEAPALDEAVIGLGTLQLMPQFLFDEP